MKNKQSLVFMGMVLTAMSAAVNAEAQTANYPGSNCVVYGGTGTLYNFSTIGNNSAGTLYLDCPAVNQTPSSIEGGWVNVMDQNTTENVCCSLNSAYGSGSSIWGWWGTTVCSSGYSSNWTKLNFGPLGNNSDAHIYLSCTIPRVGVGPSWIATYNVNE